MCFSATASFASGAVLCTLGAVTIERTVAWRERAIASIPFIFGVQQTIEGFIWMNAYEVQVGSSLVMMGPRTLSYAFSFFSLILWPVFVPVAILMIESSQRTLKWMRACLVPAAMTSIYFIYVAFKFPIFSVIQENHIQYHFTTHPPAVISFCYCVATVLPCVLSTHRWIKGVGAVLITALVFSHVYFDDAFVSVWCFFAALLSVFIYIHFFLRRRRFNNDSKNSSNLRTA